MLLWMTLMGCSIPSPQSSEKKVHRKPQDCVTSQPIFRQSALLFAQPLCNLDDAVLSPGHTVVYVETPAHADFCPDREPLFRGTWRSLRPDEGGCAQSGPSSQRQRRSADSRCHETRCCTAAMFRILPEALEHKTRGGTQLVWTLLDGAEKIKDKWRVYLLKNKTVHFSPINVTVGLKE